MSGTKLQKLPPKPPVEFTAARKEKFIEEFAKSGLVYATCAAIGINARTYEAHRKTDPEFAARADEAHQYFIDHVLVAAATSRAVKGFKRPILGGRFKDEIVAHEQVYSDGLMSVLLRSKRGEFREGAGSESGGVGRAGGVLLVPTAPMTMDDWEASFGELARGQTRDEDTE